MAPYCLLENKHIPQKSTEGPRPRTGPFACLSCLVSLPHLMCSLSQPKGLMPKWLHPGPARVPSSSRPHSMWAAFLVPHSKGQNSITRCLMCCLLTPTWPTRHWALWWRMDECKLQQFTWKEKTQHILSSWAPKIISEWHVPHCQSICLLRSGKHVSFQGLQHARPLSLVLCHR